MAHIGILAIPVPSHLDNCLAIAKELDKRGHQVTFYQISDSYAKISAAGIRCRLVGEKQFPPGWRDRINREFGQLEGIKAVRYAIKNYFYPLAALNLEEVPDALKRDSVDLLVVDQLATEGGTIADYINIPYVSLCTGTPYNIDVSVPPSVLPWSYSQAWWAIRRNQIGYILISRLTKPLWNLVASYRQKWGLPLYTSLNDPFSKLAQISPQPQELEFPRRHLPAEFHFCGPLINRDNRDSVPFPYEKLNGKPLIYASMGTLLNRQQDIFQTIAAACVGLDVQLVLSLGQSVDLANLPKFAGELIVVNYAPQLELLQRASLTITHAGINTTTESLREAVPLVAIPIGNDQPGVAARIVWTGVGECVPLSRLTVERLRKAINQVLTIPSYSENARRLQTAIQNSGGVVRAAQVIENVLAQSPHKFTNS
jgi:MGT family glycosyltransferase